MNPETAEKIEQDMSFVRAAVTVRDQRQYGPVATVVLWATLIGIGFTLLDFYPRVAMWFMFIAPPLGYFASAWLGGRAERAHRGDGQSDAHGSLGLCVRSHRGDAVHRVQAPGQRTDDGATHDAGQWGSVFLLRSPSRPALSLAGHCPRPWVGGEWLHRAVSVDHGWPCDSCQPHRQCREDETCTCRTERNQLR